MNPLFEKIIAHKGHEIEVGVYGDYYNPVNAAVECINCYEVIIGADREEESEE